MAWGTLTDVQMYYELLGSGDPLLLIPGLGATTRLWDPILPELAERFSVISPDNRGAGRSISKRPLKSLCDLSSDLVELLDTLQVDRAHVMGISMGGVVAQRLAVDHPSRVDHLVLISTAHQYGPYLRQMAMLLAHALRRFPYRLFLQTMELLGTAPMRFDQFQDEIQRSITQRCRDKSEVRDFIGQLRALGGAHFDEREYKITCPTLVLSGAFDALVPNCYAQRMSDEIPGSRFVVLEGCGHNPIAERPDAVLDELFRFWSPNKAVANCGPAFATDQSGGRQ
jgi:3-oxoadipate enol-lactonase